MVSAPDKDERCDVSSTGRGLALSPERPDERMANGGRSHAWLPRLREETGDPFLPEVGELYLVKTIIYSSSDPAADRSVVVVLVPSVPHGTIQFFTRTSKTDVPGIKHPADLSLRCDRDGVFSDLASAEQRLWTPQNVTYLGLLGEPYLAKVLERAE